MSRRFARGPLATAWPAQLLLCVALAVVLLVTGAGCGDTFVPQTTTLTDAPATEETTADSVLEFDPAASSADDWLAVWSQVAERVGFDPAAAKPFEIMLVYVPSRSLVSRYVWATTGDHREVRVSQEGPATPYGRPGHMVVEITWPTAPGGGGYLGISVESALRALAVASPDSLLTKITPAGTGGTYQLSLFDLAGEIETSQSIPAETAYAWDGHAFQTADLHDSTYLDPQKYVCFAASSTAYSTATTPAPPQDIFMYMTTTHYLTAGEALFLIPLYTSPGDQTPAGSRTGSGTT